MRFDAEQSYFNCEIHFIYCKTGYFSGHVIFAVDIQSAKINDRYSKSLKKSENRRKDLLISVYNHRLHIT